MENKKKTIKMVGLMLTTLLFFSMIYITFFKGKAPLDNLREKNQPPLLDQKNQANQHLGALLQGRPAPETFTGGIISETGENRGVPFKDEIKNVFFPSDLVKKSLEKKTPPVPITASSKRAPLSELERNSIHKTLRFKGSILGQNRSVAIINGAFLHVGDRVNGYQVTSISEKMVNIDTGRGLLALELMTHE
jgi:hypothetical protein